MNRQTCSEVVSSSTHEGAAPIILQGVNNRHRKAASSRLRSCLAVLVTALLIFGSRPAAQAITITYTATDLADVVVGEDLWQSSYTLSGFVFQANQGFTIYSAYNLYKNLSAASVHPDWDLLVIQPDTGIPADGFYDNLALVNGASLSAPFILDFVWLGLGTPGAQAFQIYDLTGGFQILNSGTTQSAAVPESGGWLLTAIWIALLVGLESLRRFWSGSEFPSLESKLELVAQSARAAGPR